LVIYLLFKSYQLRDDFKLNQRGRKLYTSLHKIFFSIIIIALVANLIGSVKLSDLLLTSIIKTLLMGVVTVTIVIILNSLLILLIKGKRAKSIPIFEQLKKLIDKRIKPLINWGGMIFWVIITLQIFGLLKAMRYWFDELMDTSFVVAGASISIGGIISFALIAVFTFVIARFVKNLFKDEWVSNSKLKQGTASALSMTIRYIIVAFGIYLALNAAGLNMNEFGFMAGALGVGIGFGLQNIVLNFIAGIILAFEQPIHVGDVIEVDQFMGRVTEIGVRASKIMTWSGSEVIVPNGQLISNKVVNWTLTDQKRRLEINFKTAIEADPEMVIDILRETAEEHPNTLKTPLPMALFNGFGDSSLDFTLYCWVDFSISLSAKSEIAVNAHKTLAKAGIPTPVSMHKFQISQDINKNLPEE
jgi:potassium efflux system protein